MSGRLKTLFLIGIIILFLPYFGIPDSWKTVIDILFGVIIIYLSISLKRQYKFIKAKLHKWEQPVINNDIQIHE